MSLSEKVITNRITKSEIILKEMGIECLSNNEMEEFKKRNKLNYSSDLKLRKFQMSFIESNKSILVLETPTGSGKTLAALGRVILKGDSHRGIFFYPTKELAKEQINSMASLIKQFNYEPLIINPNDIVQYIDDQNWVLNLFKALKLNREKKVVLIDINGDSLFDFIETLGNINSNDENFHYKNKNKGRFLFQMLNILSQSGISSIICTNLDFLFMIQSRRFKFSSQIWEILISWNNLIIDEFHLYGRLQALYLLTMLVTYYKTIELKNDSWMGFLSATPSDLSKIIIDSFQNNVEKISTELFYDITPTISKIRFETKINFININQSLSEMDIESFLIPIISNALDSTDYKSFSVDVEVKLLILVNSNVFCEQLFSKMIEKFPLNKENLFQINGFIPSKSRQKINEMKNAILIGTRAIDIGIDFNVPFLIFESFDRSTFYQRLGRGGRHQKCKIIALVPTQLKDRIDLQTSKSNKLTYEELKNITNQSLKQEEEFFDFIFSREGIELILLFIHSFVNPGGSYIDNKTKFIYDKLRESLIYLKENKKLELIDFDELKRQKIIYVTKNHDEFMYKSGVNILKSISEKIAFRGNLISIPCYFDKYKVWKLISIFEIRKMEFIILTYESWKKANSEQNSPPILWNLHKNSIILYVKNIHKSKNILNFDSSFQINKLKFLKKNSSDLVIEGSNEILSEKINILLTEISPIPCIITGNYLDWRINYIVGKNNNKLKVVIGEEAYLVNFIINNE